MPFIDLDKKTPQSFLFPDTDVVIIGAGTAGILLAVSLTLKGKTVSIIESGHFEHDEEKQKLNSVEQTGKELKNASWGRKRVIGGTTVSWGGQSLPFAPLDFREREWVENSGWPISFSDLAPYYRAADAFMGIDTLNYSTDIFPKIKVSDPGVDPSTFDFHVAKWTNKKNFYTEHSKLLEEKVNVFYNAQLTGINKDHNNIIGSIEVCNFKNDTFIFPVNTLILAAGTIETIRILLTNGIGNDSGLLGKYFMDHPCIEVGTIETVDMYKLQRMFNTHVWNGRKYSLRLSLAKDFQLKNQLLNCSASILFRPPKGSFDIHAELKLFKKDLKLKRLIKLLASTKSILRIGSSYLIHRFYYKPKAAARLTVMIEQEPTEDSFISLSDHTDQFNIPQASIHWTITKKTWVTAIATANALKERLEGTDAGEVNLFEHIDPNTSDWENYLSDVCHNMGGCRMSASAEEGVVDKNLQVWEVANLFICSQAVFPTGSHSNPVLTMLALALRLTDHISVARQEDQLLKMSRQTFAESL
jgi:hypothetical protein